MKVSIIIPVYNVELYIERCLLSVLNQTYQDIEIILVDDCGTDNSIAIAQQIINIHPNGYKVHILKHEQNRGLSAARNTGIMVATGEYIWFVDSDDWIEDSFINKLSKRLNYCSSELIVFDAYFHFKNEIRKTIVEIIPGQSCSGFKFMKISPLYSVWNILYKRNFLYSMKLAFKEGVLHEDGDFNIKAFAFAKDIVYCPIIGYHYRTDRKGSITNIISLKRIVSALKIVELNNQFIRENNFGRKNESIIMRHRWQSVSYVLLLSQKLDRAENEEFDKQLIHYKKELCYCAYHTNSFFYILQIPFLYFFPIHYVKLKLSAINIIKWMKIVMKNSFI